MRHYITLFAFVIASTLGAQPLDSLQISTAETNASELQKHEIYRINPLISGGIIALGTITNDIGFKRLRREQASIDVATLAGLGPDDVPQIDRWALRQNPENADDAEEISNLGLSIGAAFPLLLFTQKDMRQDWLDISLMYLETQALASNFYSWGPLGPTFIQRLRPLTWYDEFPIEERNGGNNRNSFFSGHVSSTATGTYFTAKVFCDYRPELSFGQRALVYTIASAPPIFVAINRVRALRHFPSDTLIGLGVGAFIGTIVPQFHKQWAERHETTLRLSSVYNADVKGLGFALTF